MKLQWTVVITVEVQNGITKQEVEGMTYPISIAVKAALRDLNDAKVEIKPPSTSHLPNFDGNLKGGRR